ncbi:hypothetical protein HHI36_014935 [Cryptolaemus montrouzieri]|uniref:Uncharacterized protein n=1 Tax=Cryptolaemus montrouzieri TaxID=559131 RepID=A0ABD2N4M1_9CUCU
MATNGMVPYAINLYSIYNDNDVTTDISDAEIVFNESNLDFTDLLDENDIHSLDETSESTTNDANEEPISIQRSPEEYEDFGKVSTEECTDVYTTEPNIRILDMHLIMPPHSQNETTVSEHTDDEMKINYTETNIHNQSNVIGGETNNQDVQTVNVPSPFETVLF